MLISFLLFHLCLTQPPPIKRYEMHFTERFHTRGKHADSWTIIHNLPQPQTYLVEAKGIPDSGVEVKYIYNNTNTMGGEIASTLTETTTMGQHEFSETRTGKMEGSYPVY